jgi:hypothetical protein
MKNLFILLIASWLMFMDNTGFAQISNVSAQATEDSTIGVKPIIKIENLSPEGHCENQQLSFLAPWADHFEIAKRRSDTSWIKDFKPVNNWSYQTLKPGVNGMIYKSLDEKGTFQFVVKAYKGTRYRISDTITRKSCVAIEIQK